MDAIIMGSAPAAPEPAVSFKLGIAKYFLDGPNAVDPMDAPVQEVWDAKMAALGFELVDLDEKIPGFSESIGGEGCLGPLAPFGPEGAPPGMLEGGLDGMVSFPICFGETKDDMSKYLAQHVTPVTGMDYEAFVAALTDSHIKGTFEGPIAAGSAFPGYAEAMSQHRPALQAAYRAAFEHVDAVIFPTVRHLAVKIDGEDTDSPGTFPKFIHNTDPGSNSGFPGVTIPLGSTVNNATDKELCCVGLALDGLPGSDVQLLQIALALQRKLQCEESK